MAIVTKTMEEILEEVTPEDVMKMCEELLEFEDEYDPENPPLTKEELQNLTYADDTSAKGDISSPLRVA